MALGAERAGVPPHGSVYLPQGRFGVVGDVHGAAVTRMKVESPD